MANCSLWHGWRGNKNNVTAGRAWASPVSRSYSSPAGWGSRIGLGVITGFNQEPKSTSKFLVLRQVWDQTGKSIPSLRSGPSAVMASPVKRFLGSLTVMMQVEGQSEGQSRSVRPMARHSSCCNWAGNWHLQQRLKAEWPEMSWAHGQVAQMDGQVGLLRVSAI